MFGPFLLPLYDIFVFSYDVGLLGLSRFQRFHDGSPIILRELDKAHVGKAANECEDADESMCSDLRDCITLTTPSAPIDKDNTLTPNRVTGNDCPWCPGAQKRGRTRSTPSATPGHGLSLPDGYGGRGYIGSPCGFIEPRRSSLYCMHALCFPVMPH